MLLSFAFRLPPPLARPQRAAKLRSGSMVCGKEDWVDWPAQWSNPAVVAAPGSPGGWDARPGTQAGIPKKCRPTGDEPGGRQHERRRHPTLPHCSAVPSAQPGLTSLFGMGRGGTPAQWPPVFSFAWPMAACVAHSTQESNLPAGTKKAPGKVSPVETFGQLVALGFGVAAFTPAPYQRRSLRRPSRSPNLADGFALRCFQRLS